MEQMKRRRKIRAIPVAAMLALVAVFLPASSWADENCAQELREIKEILAQERLDDYTANQVRTALEAAEKAIGANSIADCEAAVQTLKHLLHLDH